MNTTYWYIVVVLIILLGGVVWYSHSSNTTPTTETATGSSIADYDTFATCLADAGATFYGAFWCPHCQDQKELLNDSDTVPYVECSTPDGESQTQVCIDAGITSYPTWRFADGSELTGVQQLSVLADKTSCALPGV